MVKGVALLLAMRARQRGPVTTAIRGQSHIISSGMDKWSHHKLLPLRVSSAALALFFLPTKWLCTEVQQAQPWWARGSGCLNPFRVISLKFITWHARKRLRLRRWIWLLISITARLIIHQLQLRCERPERVFSLKRGEETGTVSTAGTQIPYSGGKNPKQHVSHSDSPSPYAGFAPGLKVSPLQRKTWQTLGGTPGNWSAHSSTDTSYRGTQNEVVFLQ